MALPEIEEHTTDPQRGADAMRTHSLERTSPTGKGQKFLGICVNCGATNLPAEAALWPCPNPDGVTQDDALIAAVTRDSDENQPIYCLSPRGRWGDAQ